MTFELNLEQLRKQAKERVRERRAAGLQVRLADAQFELARELGFSGWPALRAYVERLGREQPFRTDLDYYAGRARGIATVNRVGFPAARDDLAARHGFSGWRALSEHVGAMERGETPKTPFVLAYEAIEADDVVALAALLDRFGDLVRLRGTNGNDLLGMARSVAAVRLLLERGADPNRGNDYGWTKLHGAASSDDRELAQVLLDAGADPELSARGDGGTPLIAALFWGNRRVVSLLGREPGNLRVAAGLGDVAMIDALIGTPAAGAHREFYRPHGGFPAWPGSDDPGLVLDEALVWAAKAGRVEAIGRLVELGARVDADPYRGTALTWAAFRGRVEAIRELVALGADVDCRSSFGGPEHGEGVTALHLAAEAGRVDAVVTLLELGADPSLLDDLYRSDAAGWAQHGHHPDLARRISVGSEPGGGQAGREDL